MVPCYRREVYYRKCCYRTYPLISMALLHKTSACSLKEPSPQMCIRDSNKTYRRINNNMYLFIGFLFVFLGIYILFTLNINEFVFNLFGIMAVSYTHLDVYKRQGHGNRNGTDEVIRTDNGSIQSHLLCPVLLLLFITEIIPVSYTHLI